MPESRIRRLAEALHAGRDHTRDGVPLGHEPICNCYSLAGKAIPVAFEFCAEAWDEGHRFTGYEPLPGENPYRISLSNDAETP
jgi:hypothetical protein